MKKYLIPVLILIFLLNTNIAFSASYNATSVLGQNDENLDYFLSKVFPNDYLGDLIHTNPKDVVVDEENKRVFVSDSGANRILVYNLESDGSLSDLFIDYYIGQSSVAGTNPSCSSTGLNNPGGLALDSATDTLFVVDTGNERVLAYDLTDLMFGMAASKVLGQSSMTSCSSQSVSDKTFNFDDGLDSDDIVITNGIDVSDDSMLFVADGGNNRVLVFDVSSINNNESAVYVIGQDDFVTNTKGGSDNEMRRPSDVQYDDTKDLLYVYDAHNLRVGVYDFSTPANGLSMSNVLGQSVLDESVYNVRQASGFNNPTGVYIDQTNSRAYVSDYGNDRVLVFDLGVDGLPEDVFADYIIGQPNLASGVSGSCSQYSLNGPHDVFVDENGYLFVSDSVNNRVMVYDTSELENYMPATYVLGQESFDSCNSGLGADDFNFSGQRVAFAYDEAEDYIYVTDMDNDRVLVFDISTITTGEDAIYVLGQPDFTSNTGAAAVNRLNQPRGIDIDLANKLIYVADTANHRVMVFNVNTITNGEDAVNVLGQINFTNSSAATAQGRLNNPRGLSYYPNLGLLFVSQTSANRVSVFDVNTIVDGENAVNVLCQTTFTAGSSANTQSRCGFPQGMGIDTDNQLLWVSETTGNRVKVFDIAAISDGENAVDLLGQTNDSGDVVYTTASSNNGSASFKDGSTFETFRGFLSLDEDNQILYVSDGITGTSASNDRVLVFDVDTLIDGESAINVLCQSDFTSGGSGSGAGGCYNASGGFINTLQNTFYLADEDNNRVKVFDVSAITDGEDAVQTLGQFALGTTTASLTTNYSADTYAEGEIKSTGFAKFNDEYYGQGVVFSNQYNILFVSDTENQRVLGFNTDSDGNPLDNIADHILGGTDLEDSGNGDLSATGLEHPGSMAIDDQYLYVSDSYDNYRIMVYDLSNLPFSGTAASYVLGQDDFVSKDNADPTQNRFSLISGIDIDTENSRLFVSDTWNGRVLVFDLSSGITNGMDASYVLGTDDFVTASGYDEGIDKLYIPGSLEYDPDSKYLYVANSEESNSVSVFDLSSGITNGMDASYVLGTDDFNELGSDDCSDLEATPWPMGLGLNTQNQTLAVSSYTCHAIYVFDVSTITNGENPIAVIGQEDFQTGTLSSSVNAATLNQPKGIDISDDGKKMYVFDTGNSRVLIYNLLYLKPINLGSIRNTTNNSLSIPIENEQGSLVLELVSGALPDNMSIDGSNIVGEPGTLGDFTFSLRAIDTVGESDFYSNSAEFVLTVTTHTTSGYTSKIYNEDTNIEIDIEDIPEWINEKLDLGGIFDNMITEPPEQSTEENIHSTESPNIAESGEGQLSDSPITEDNIEEFDYDIASDDTSSESTDIQSDQSKSRQISFSIILLIIIIFILRKRILKLF